METRKGLSAFSELPSDYLKMVGEVFKVNFDAGLKALTERTAAPASFLARGRIYADEIVLCVSLLQEGRLSATSVYASTDYDPKASAPTLEDLLAAAVDATGAIFGQLLGAGNEKALERLADESLSALENVPIDWSELQVERHRIFVKVDRSNPSLDKMAEDWLDKNDPSRASVQEEQEQSAEKLFVTGPGGPKRPPGTKDG